MKKFVTIALSLLLVCAAIAGCAPKAEAPAAEAPAAEAPAAEAPAAEPTVIRVGASITPHAEILAQVKDALASEGYTLEIVEYTDYVQPNLALEAGDLDANYFQHQPYLDEFNAENGTHIATVAAIHYEPFGIYPGTAAALADLKDGDKIAVPNDGTNEARALLLLEANGLITLKEGVGLSATKIDIAENPHNYDIVEIEAAQLSRSLQDVAVAVINGNYAIQAGLSVANDAIAVEDKDSVAAQTYANILCVKEGNEANAGIVALSAALQSDAVREYINSTYDGAVIPKF